MPKYNRSREMYEKVYHLYMKGQGHTVVAAVDALKDAAKKVRDVFGETVYYPPFVQVADKAAESYTLQYLMTAEPVHDVPGVFSGYQECKAVGLLDIEELRTRSEIRIKWQETHASFKPNCSAQATVYHMRRLDWYAQKARNDVIQAQDEAERKAAAAAIRQDIRVTRVTVGERRWGGYTRHELMRISIAELVTVARMYGIDPNGLTPATVVELICENLVI